MYIKYMSNVYYISFLFTFRPPNNDLFMSL